MRLCVDITPLTSSPTIGTGKVIENLIQALEKKRRIKLCFYALVSRGLLKKIRPAYPHLKAIKIPAKLSRISWWLAQRLGMPLELIAGPADASVSIGPLSLPLRSGKTVAIIADATPITHPHWCKPETVFWFKERIKAIYKHADLIVTISHSVKRDIVRELQIRPSKILVAYPGVSQNFLMRPSALQLKSVKKKYKLPKSYVLFVGIKAPRKNLNRLIKAFIKLKPRIKKNTKLLLVGPTGWGEKHKASDHIKSLGFVPDKDLPAIYALSQGLAYPSLKEGFGFPIVEAFATGIPVLTSNNSSMKEISKGASILVNPESTASIKKGLEQLLTLRQSTKAQLVKAGRDKLTQLSFDTMAETLITAIQKLP